MIGHCSWFEYVECHLFFLFDNIGNNFRKRNLESRVMAISETKIDKLKHDVSTYCDFYHFFYWLRGVPAASRCPRCTIIILRDTSSSSCLNREFCPVEVRNEVFSKVSF